jgi:hypothetical protein
MLKGIWESKNRKKTLWGIAAGLTVLVLAVSAAFFFKEYQDIRKDPKAKAEATSKRVVDRVSELYFLPENEEPTVAQIEDKTKLEGQSFFDSARNGDYLLVYTKAKIALLYREGENKLVNVGPVNTDQSDVAGESTQQ